MHIFKKRQRLKKNNEINNKAQTSLFVIIGLIMMVGAVVGYVVYNRIKTSRLEEEAKSTAQLSSQADEIKKFINDCIRKTTYDGLKRLGDTGGYLDVPNLINFRGTGYWHLEQVNIQPFLNQTQERLLQYLEENIPKCIDDKKIQELGFQIKKGNLKTSIEFGKADVTVQNIYPIKLSKEKFSKEFSEFFNAFDIRYRAVFEAASEVNEKIFDADFEVKNPLKKLEYMKNLSFELDYKTPEPDIMAFTVTDKKSKTPTNEFYTFNFAVKFGNSELIKTIDMQNNSASNPTFLAYTIYSVDKKAQLEISSGTTVSLNSSSVKAISVQQSYPSEVVTKDVPVYKKNNEVLQKQDIKYVIDNPIYSFEPSGILFNKFQKLTLYYNNETKASQGVGILMGKKGFWVPIASKHEPENKKVFTNILGFTQFTALNCAVQPVKKTIAEHFFEANAGCFVQLGLMIAVIIILTAIGYYGWPALLQHEGGLAIAATTTEEVTKLGVIESVKAAFTFGAAETVAGISLGTIFYAATVGLTLMTIIGATVSDFYGKTNDNCERFYPICDQTITIDKKETDGTGLCIPDKDAQVTAGNPVELCAQVEKCNFINKFFCQSCSVKCTASFK